MSTRSDIIVQRADGKWHRIYCHSDGYLEHNGRILFDHYTSQAQAEKLVALGDLSALGPKIGRKHPFNRPPRFIGQQWEETNPAYVAYKEKYDGMCLAYGRDRGDKDVAGCIGDSLPQVWPEAGCWTEFTYVWTEGQWFVADPDTGSQALVNLGDALSGNIALTPAVKAFGATIGQHVAHDPAQPAKHAWKSNL
jgi:hypothetical protein